MRLLGALRVLRVYTHYILNFNRAKDANGLYSVMHLHQFSVAALILLRGVKEAMLKRIGYSFQSTMHLKFVKNVLDMVSDGCCTDG